MDWGLQGWGCYEAAEFKEQQDLKQEKIGKWEKIKEILGVEIWRRWCEKVFADNELNIIAVSLL